MSTNSKPAHPLVHQAQTADGRRVYVVICPGCKVNLSKVSLGRHLLTPHGKVSELWHPVSCPECGYYLLEVTDLSPVVRPT